MWKLSPSKACCSVFTTWYLHDEANSVAEVDASGTLLARYAQGAGIDEPLAELRGGTAAFYEQDELGSVTSLSSSTGTISNSYTYEAFGNLTASAGLLGNPFQYTGRDFDSETGLRYYRARYYDPQTGRFTSEDPARLTAGINFYRYVKNDPTDMTDPTGMYELKGFSPTQAAEMSLALGQLAAKLREQKCCLDPKLRDRILSLLQPFRQVVLLLLTTKGIS